MLVHWKKWYLIKYTNENEKEHTNVHNQKWQLENNQLFQMRLFCKNLCNSVLKSGKNNSLGNIVYKIWLQSNTKQTISHRIKYIV